MASGHRLRADMNTETMTLMNCMDYDLFARVSSTESGVEPLVASLRQANCQILSNCEGHGAHEPGILYTSEPYVLFVPPHSFTRDLSAIQSSSAWRQLSFEWTISLCDHIDYEFAYRISPRRFQRDVEKKLNQSSVGMAIGLFSYKKALKHSWPEIRKFIDNDVAAICRMLLNK